MKLKSRSWSTRLCPTKPDEYPILLSVPPRQDEYCAIEEFFRQNPDKSYVHMVCYCRRCTPQFM